MDLNYSKLENSPIGEQIISNFKAFLDSVSKLINSIAPDYDATKTYAVGDYCVHDFRLYRCTTEITTAEDFDSAKWTEVHVVDEIADSSASSSGSETTTVDSSSVLLSLFDAYDESKEANGEYRVGDYVVKDGKLMKLSHVDDVWDDTKGEYVITCHWVDASIGDELGGARYSVYGGVEGYNPSNRYNVGRYCCYNGYIYRCEKTTTGGDFDSSCWRRVVLDELVDGNTERIISTYDTDMSDDAEGGTYRYDPRQTGIAVKPSKTETTWAVTSAMFEIANLYKSLIANEFSKSNSYAVGDYVRGRQNGCYGYPVASILRKCTTALDANNKSNPENTSNFKYVTVADELAGIRNRFGGFVIKEVEVDLTSVWQNRQSLSYPKNVYSNELSDEDMINDSATHIHLLSAECSGSAAYTDWHAIPVGNSYVRVGYSDAKVMSDDALVFLDCCDDPNDVYINVRVKDAKCFPKHIRLLLAYKPSSSVEVDKY